MNATGNPYAWNDALFSSSRTASAINSVGAPAGASPSALRSTCNVVADANAATEGVELVAQAHRERSSRPSRRREIFPSTSSPTVAARAWSIVPRAHLSQQRLGNVMPDAVCLLGGTHAGALFREPPEQPAQRIGLLHDRFAAARTQSHRLRKREGRRLRWSRRLHARRTTAAFREVPRRRRRSGMRRSNTPPLQRPRSRLGGGGNRHRTDDGIGLDPEGRGDAKRDRCRIRHASSPAAPATVSTNAVRSSRAGVIPRRRRAAAIPNTNVLSPASASRPRRRPPADEASTRLTGVCAAPSASVPARRTASRTTMMRSRPHLP